MENQSKILFNTLKIDLNKDFPELLPFFRDILLTEDYIEISFLNKIKKFDDVDKEIKTFEIPDTVLNNLFKISGYLSSNFTNDISYARYDSDKLILIKEIYRRFDFLTETFSKPFSDFQLLEQNRLINLLQSQKEGSLLQAKNIDKTLTREAKPLLEKMELKNKAFEKTLEDCKKQGLLD